MSLVRVHNFAISLDGFGTGEGQSATAHFGHAEDRLHQWMFATRWWQPGGSAGVDDAFVQRHEPGIGAEIMGAGKWGHPGWHEDPEWKGAWGPNPPFHTPVFVLTHHPRPSLEMEGGTTFHFVDASPAEALETARNRSARHERSRPGLTCVGPARSVKPARGRSRRRAWLTIHVICSTSQAPAKLLVDNARPRPVASISTLYVQRTKPAT